MDMLAENQNYQLKTPGATGDDGPLYLRMPKMLEASLRKNLDMAISDLISSGDKITFTDPMLNGASLPVIFKFEKKE